MGSRPSPDSTYSRVASPASVRPSGCCPAATRDPDRVARANGASRRCPRPNADAGRSGACAPQVRRLSPRRRAAGPAPEALRLVGAAWALYAASSRTVAVDRTGELRCSRCTRLARGRLEAPQSVSTNPADRTRSVKAPTNVRVRLSPRRRDRCGRPPGGRRRLPLVGVTAYGWHFGTLLAVYWLEAVKTVLLAAVKALFAESLDRVYRRRLHRAPRNPRETGRARGPGGGRRTP